MLVSRWSCREKQTGVWSRLRLLSWLGGECGHRRHAATITRPRTGQGLWNKPGGLTTETLPRSYSFYDGVQLLLKVSELAEFSSGMVAAALILVRCTAHARGQAPDETWPEMSSSRRGRPAVQTDLEPALALFYCTWGIPKNLPDCKWCQRSQKFPQQIRLSGVSQAGGKFHCGISL